MKFGHYELLERVAVGGMAEVFRGRVVGAEGFEKWVAIKRILPEFAKDDRFISMMLTEARIHSALSHRNIVQIHDLGTSEDGEYFIVLEYVEGHDLRAVLEAASALGVQVPDTLALHIAEELAEALHFAHQLCDPEGQPLGIVHRDVSPSNVLISNSGEVKLSDFGIAKRRRDHSVVGSLKGNLAYMSPEQARREALDRRTDVFSLGAVLFEMLTGGKVREVADGADSFQRAASGPVRSAMDLRPDLLEAYASILAKALATDPADRFSDAASFGAAIRELQRGGERPVGPTDVQELIEVLDPPRRARSPVELSRVIRLGPEIPFTGTPETPPPREAQKGATPTAMSGGPPEATPAPTVRPSSAAAPRPVPPAPSPRPRATTEFGIGAASPAGSTPANRPPGAGLFDPRQTPPAPRRTPPPPPGFSVGAPPNRAGPLVVPAPSPTSLGLGMATERARAALNAVVALAPPVTPAPTSLSASRTVPQVGGGPNISPLGFSRASPATVTPPPEMARRANGRGVPQSSPTPADQARHLDLAPASYAADPRSTPPAPLLAQSQALALRATPPAMVSLLPLGPSRARTLPGGGWPLQEYPTNNAWPSGRVAPNIRINSGRWRSLAVLFLAVLSAAGAVVHFKVIPLEVLAVWRRPAVLVVTSEPPGATALLDGRTLPGLTPIRAEVKRDRAEHVLELQRPGSISARTVLRFDRALVLEASLGLDAEPPPPLPSAAPLATEQSSTVAGKASADKASPGKASPSDESGLARTGGASRDGSDRGPDRVSSKRLRKSRAAKEARKAKASDGTKPSKSRKRPKTGKRSRRRA